MYGQNMILDGIKNTITLLESKFLQKYLKIPQNLSAFQF